MSQSGHYLGRFAARAISALIIPIALPAWTIERVVNHFRPGWQFSPYAATPYFLILTLISSLALLYLGTLWMVIAAYAMTAMELLAIWLCVSIAIARPGGVYMWLREFGKRHTVPERHALLTSKHLYEGIVSYGFTIYYFAFIYFVVHRLSPASFEGMKATTPIGTLWAFIYYSVVTITTLGYGDIVPGTPIAQAATVIELFAGFFFVVFLFSAFVSYQISKLR